MPQTLHKEWQIMLGFHFVLVALHRRLWSVLSKTNRVGDTNDYNIVSSAALILIQCIFFFSGGGPKCANPILLAT